MCVIFASYLQNQRFPLIIAANRDEFFERPTSPAGFWDDYPQIYAGRDLVANGTWLGITKSGRFAAVTNYRDPKQPKGVRSRGDLVADFLKSDVSTAEYLTEVAARKDDYTGFGFLAGEISARVQEFFYYSNHIDAPQELAPGIYGLSNALLETPWPKVKIGKAAFEKMITGNELNKKGIFDLLQDKSQADEADLPDTGVGREIETYLSPIFVETPIYGTRCSTVVTIDAEFKAELEERVFV